MRRREHGLDRWQALGRRRQSLAGPELSDGVHGLADALDRAIGRVGDAHLLEAQGEARAEGHDQRPGAISSSAEPVMASTTGCRVNGLTAPSATRNGSLTPGSPTRPAMAETKLMASRSK